MDMMTRAYLACALWSSCDENDEPFDAHHTVDDIAGESVREAERTCQDFRQANKDLLDESGLGDDQIGHDLWLTRNGHGAGFWDRGLGQTGEELTAMCKPYGEAHLYRDASGLVNIQG